MKSLDHTALTAAVLGAGCLLGACTAATLTAGQYPTVNHVGGIDEGGLLASGRQLAITLAPNGTIVTKTATAADPPAAAGHAYTDGGRGISVTASLGGFSPGTSAHALGAKSPSGHGGGGGGGGGGGK